MKDHLSPHLDESSHRRFLFFSLSIFHSFHRFIELFAPVGIMHTGWDSNWCNRWGFFFCWGYSLFPALSPSLAPCAAPSGTSCCAPSWTPFFTPSVFLSDLQDFPSLLWIPYQLASFAVGMKRINLLLSRESSHHDDEILNGTWPRRR